MKLKGTVRKINHEYYIEFLGNYYKVKWADGALIENESVYYELSVLGAGFWNRRIKWVETENTPTKMGV